MNRSAIKSFATWARTHLLEQVAARAVQLGITEKDIATPQIIPGGMVLAGQTHDAATTRQYLALRAELEHRLEHAPQKEVVRSLLDDMAYTWFNRLAALRFMEVNGYIVVHPLS